MQKLITSAALAVAGGVHLAAFPEHWRSGATVAGFFLVVALLQIVAAMLVMRGAGSRVRTAVVVGNISLLALWAWSRTTGLPIGPHSGVPEAAGLLDLTAVGAQVIAVVATFFLPRLRSESRLVRPQLALLGAFLLVAISGAQLVPAAHASGQGDYRADPANDHAEPHSHP